MSDPRSWFACRCGVETTDPPGFPAPCRAYAFGMHVWREIVGVAEVVAGLEQRIAELEGLLREFQRCGEGLTTSYIDWEDVKRIEAVVGPLPPEAPCPPAENPPTVASTTRTLVDLWSSETAKESRKLLLSMPNPWLERLK